MAVFLSISVGPTPATARPLLASTNPDVARAAVRALVAAVDDLGPLPGFVGAPRLVAETEARS